MMSLSLIKFLATIAGNLYLLKYAHRMARATKKRGMNCPRYSVTGEIVDLTHEVSSGAYLFISSNEVLTRSLLIVLAVHINLCIGILIYKSCLMPRIWLVIIGVYLTKALCNAVYHAPPPDGRINRRLRKRKLHWSIASQQETFFSGHTSLCALAYLFCSNSIKPFILIGSIFTVLCILILRVHYIIDIISALLCVFFYYTIIM